MSLSSPAYVTEARALFVAAVDRSLRRRGMSVQFIEHNVVTELRDTGALPGGGRVDGPVYRPMSAAIGQWQDGPCARMVAYLDPRGGDG